MTVNELKSVIVSSDPDNQWQKAKRLLVDVLEQIADNRVVELISSEKNGHEVVLEIEYQGSLYKLIRTEIISPQLPMTLSPREDEIVRMVAEGLPNKGIADVLDISPWTVATHLRRIFLKLGVGSRAEMIACVMRNHMLVGQ